MTEIPPVAAPRCGLVFELGRPRSEPHPHGAPATEQQREHDAAVRFANREALEAQASEDAIRSKLAAGFTELAAACRRRTEQAAEECSAMLNKELNRTFDLVSHDHDVAQQHWLEQQCERARHSLILESDRALSRIYSLELSEAQGMTMRRMLDDRVPSNNLQLASGASNARDGNNERRGVQRRQWGLGVQLEGGAPRLTTATGERLAR